MEPRSRTTAIVQARMGSSRFPGKMMASLGGRPLVDYVLTRLTDHRENEDALDSVVLATSDCSKDDPLAQHVSDRWPDVTLVRGPEEDVLRRFLVVLDTEPADTVIRVTGDCPLVNTEHLPGLVEAHCQAGADVTNYRPGFEYVDKGVEVVSADALRDAADDPELTPQDREHVTALLYRRPERYDINYVDSAPFLRRGDLRLTVDMPEDLAFFKALDHRIDRDLTKMSLKEIVSVLDQNPALAQRNAHAGRKSTMHEATRIGFRCDGGVETGLGHVVGCLRLAERLARDRGIGIEFLVRENSSAVQLIKERGFSVEVLPDEVSPEDDVNRMVEKADESDWSAVVFNFSKNALDRYTPLFPRVEEADIPLVFMDNPVPPSYLHGDLVINALPHPDYSEYDPSNHPRCYDGLEYLLLDDRFRQVRGDRADVRPGVERVLVAMGGGDRPNTTALVLDALAHAQFEGYVDVVLGAANPHEKAVREQFIRLDLRGAVECDVNDMPDRMARADLGFSALGLTTYEMAYMGVPVLLIPGTPLNAQVARRCATTYSFATYVGEKTDLSPSDVAASFSELAGDRTAREHMAAEGREVVASKADQVVGWVADLAIQNVLPTPIG